MRLEQAIKKGNISLVEIAAKNGASRYATGIMTGNSAVSTDGAVYDTLLGLLNRSRGSGSRFREKYRGLLCGI